MWLGRGWSTCSEGAVVFSMHEWAPPTAGGVNFVVLGQPVGEGSTEAQRWLTALGRVSPACRWRSSVVGALARRTRVACSGIVHGVGVPALLAVSPCQIRGTEGSSIWPRGPNEASDRAQYPDGRMGPIG